MASRLDALKVAAAILGGAGLGIVVGVVLDVEGLLEANSLLVHAIAGGAIGGIVAMCLFWIVALPPTSD